jgi:hypothetical protein
VAYHIFDYGPTGRHILVDEYGRLIVTPDLSQSGYVYAYGDTGYPLAVDGAGRLLINPSGFEAALSGNYYAKDEHLVPESADTYNLGEAGTRFNTLFAQSGNFAAGMSVGGQVFEHPTPHPIEADAALFRNLRIPDYQSMASKTSAEYNVALGWMALQKITNPLENVGVGYKALQEVTVGNYNIGVGSNAGNTIVSGDYNTCIGWNADVDYHDRQKATAIGHYATASGDNQIRLGDEFSEVHCENLMVQQNLVVASGRFRNVIQVGHGAMRIYDNGSIGIGYDIFKEADNNQNVAIGNNAMIRASGQYSIAMGVSASQNLPAGSNNNVALGTFALRNDNHHTISESVGIGPSTFRQIQSNVSWGIAIGESAALFAGGNRNIAIGQKSGGGASAGTTGDNCICIGTNAGGQSLANETIAIGREALYFPPDQFSVRNIAIGYYALRQLKHMSTNCIGIGSQVGRLAGGSGIILIGDSAGFWQFGNYNTIIGNNALPTLVLTGSNNTLIGADTDLNDVSIEYSTAIGAGAVASGSNQVRLGGQTEEVHCERLQVERDFRLGVYTSGTRPSAGVPGRLIFNTDDGKINVDDGTNWTWADGTVI